MMSESELFTLSWSAHGQSSGPETSLLIFVITRIFSTNSFAVNCSFQVNLFFNALLFLSLLSFLFFASASVLPTVLSPTTGKSRALSTSSISLWSAPVGLGTIWISEWWYPWTEVHSPRWSCFIFKSRHSPTSPIGWLFLVFWSQR